MMDRQRDAECYNGVGYDARQSGEVSEGRLVSSALETPHCGKREAFLFVCYNSKKNKGGQAFPD
jgi:hypothetical protein